MHPGFEAGLSSLLARASDTDAASDADAASSLATDPGRRLDLCIAYLRRVHHFAYYEGLQVTQQASAASEQ